MCCLCVYIHFDNWFCDDLIFPIRVVNLLITQDNKKRLMQHSQTRILLCPLEINSQLNRINIRMNIYIYITSLQP